MRTTLLRVAFVLLSIALPAAAQKHENQAKGFAADKVYQFGDVDHISLFNGNVTATIPIGQKYPVSSSLSYQFVLAYGGNNWEYFSNTYNNPPNWQPPTFDLPYASPDVKTNAGFGWHLSFAGRLENSKACSGCLMFTTPDGATHNFSPQLHRGSSEPTDVKVKYTSDSTYLRLRNVDEEVIRFGTPTVMKYHDVEAADGTVYRFLRINRNLDSVRDAFGNKITVTYGGTAAAPTWTINDGHRTHSIEFIQKTVSPIVSADPATFTMIKTLRLASFDGGQAVYTFDYGLADEPVTISRLFVENQDCNVSPATVVPILRRINLPDGSLWEMGTDIGNGGASYSRAAGSSNFCSAPAIQAFSGTLLTLTLPTLGTLEWSYGEWKFPAVDSGGVCPDPTSGANICNATLSKSVGVRERIERTRSGVAISRRMYENRWLVDPIATEIVTVTTYTGPSLATPFSKSRHYFALSTGNTPSVRKRGEYGLPYTPYVVGSNAINADFPVRNPDPVTTGGERFLSQILYDGSNRIVRYSYVGYEGDDALMTYGQDSNRRQQSERTIYRDPATNADLHYTLTTSADFDGVGHYRVTTADGSAPGGGMRTTTVNYNRADIEVDLTGRDTGTYPGAFTLPPTDQPWILNTWSTREVSEAGAGAASRTLAWFDPATGFLQRTRTLAGSFRDGYDLVSEFGHEGRGNVTREDSFGGDITTEDSANGIQPLTTNEPLAVMMLPSRRYRTEHAYERGVRKQSWSVDAAGSALSFKALDLTIDANTGLPSQSRDTAGLTTTFIYDTSSPRSSLK